MLTATERVWDYFCIIAAERGVTVGQLLSYVEAAGASFLARMSGSRIAARVLAREDSRRRREGWQPSP